jgi:hypothetical protein
MVQVPERDLIDRYHALGEVERRVLELASAIYTGADERVFRACMKDLGPGFFAWKSLSRSDLSACLAELRGQGLLDGRNRCHPDIAEIAIRQAAARRLTMPGDLTPRDLADEGTWSSEAGRCIRCTGHETLGCRTRYGTVCARCALDIFRGGFGANEVAAWPPGRIIQALGPEGPHDERFAVLAHAPSVPGKAVGAWKAFHSCIVDNLGYVSESPMAGLIRQAAMDACVSIGKPVMPVLLERCRQEPWQLMANCIYAASLIDTSDRVFHNLLLRGLQHPDPEIRRHLARAAGRAQKHRWAKDALAVLGRDADSQVREEAHKARYYPHHERRQRSLRAETLPGSYFRCLAETVNRHAGITVPTRKSSNVSYASLSMEGIPSHSSRPRTGPGSRASVWRPLWQVLQLPVRRRVVRFPGTDTAHRRPLLHTPPGTSFLSEGGRCPRPCHGPGLPRVPGPSDKDQPVVLRVGLLLFSGRMEDVSKALDEAVEFIPIGVRGWMALITGDVDAGDLALRGRPRGPAQEDQGKEALLPRPRGAVLHHGPHEEARIHGRRRPSGKALAAVEASLDSGRVMASLHGVYGCLTVHPEGHAARPCLDAGQAARRT